MNQLYKGYTKNSGKKPIDKIKGVKDFRTFEEVKKFDSYGGVLADDAILIDIDDSDQSEILMNIIEKYDLNCQVIQTSRGRHFTFKIPEGVSIRNGTSKTLACGLIADIKTGEKNAVECLKINGEARFIEWEYLDDVPCELPRWLYPVNTNKDFINTDCRNTDLFEYILVLQQQLAMSPDECRQTIRIINDFVLSEPLEESEIETILRDESFEKPIFFDGKKFLHDKFASWLKMQHHIKRINGQLHVYRDGVYVPGYRNIESIMIQAFPTSKDTQRRETLKYLELLCVDNTKVADGRYIAFKNGIYDITTGTLSDFNPDIVITNLIPWNYDSATYSEIADKTLNKLAVNDESIRSLLEECIGYCFYRRNELSSSFFLTGEKSNGKSTFLQMLQDVLGVENFSALGLEELDERFTPATMFGKLANIGDDISDEFLQGKSIAHFKKLVSGNVIKAENKGQELYFYKPYVKLIFSANQIPRTKDRTGAVLRRMVIIPFLATFSKSDPDYDPYIAWKLKDEEVMKYLVRIGIEGLKRVIENAGFTKSDKAVKELNEYNEFNNPILLFINEVEESDILNQETKYVYSMYEVFCNDNGFQQMGKIAFSREIKKKLNCQIIDRKINGKKVRVFLR